MRRYKLGKDKRTWVSLTVRVPPEKYDHYKVKWNREVSTEEKVPLYLFILENQNRTIREVQTEFHITTRKAIVNFCHIHDLKLADLPPKPGKK